MNWESLYTTQRTGKNSSATQQYDPARSPFQKDYDRIIFSSPFRRLQNKTQVFPLPGAVFVHNRLTHSLEVASVGRTLGKSVGSQLVQKHNFKDSSIRNFYEHDLATVIASACLAHDIGNPPFGHSGEDAIRTFFKELAPQDAALLEKELTANQMQDLLKFEGNSNALRILTHHYNEDKKGGYELTYPTLAAIVKYPCTSLNGFDNTTGWIATKKSGFFDAEQPTYVAIAEALGIPAYNKDRSVYARHPFVYLTEAADDICYRVIDLEDAHRLKLISTEEFKNLFLPFFNYVDANDYRSISYIENKISQIKDPNLQVQYIRAMWIGLMTDKISKIFIEQEHLLLNGTLQKDLMKCLPEDVYNLIKVINQFSVKHIYNYRSVIEIELAGYTIIGGLLKEFINAVLHPEFPRSEKLLKLVSEQFTITLETGQLYNNILSIVDFIAGMTDLYAIELYRKITGINIPEIK